MLKLVQKSHYNSKSAHWHLSGQVADIFLNPRLFSMRLIRLWDEWIMDYEGNENSTSKQRSTESTFPLSELNLGLSWTSFGSRTQSSTNPYILES